MQVVPADVRLEHSLDSRVFGRVAVVHSNLLEFCHVQGGAAADQHLHLLRTQHLHSTTVSSKVWTEKLRKFKCCRNAPHFKSFQIQLCPKNQRQVAKFSLFSSHAYWFLSLSLNFSRVPQTRFTVTLDTCVPARASRLQANARCVSQKLWDSLWARLKRRRCGNRGRTPGTADKSTCSAWIPRTDSRTLKQNRK